MSLDPMDIFASLIFALIGFCYLVYGKRQQSFVFIISGLGLMAYTLVTESTAQIIWIGIVIMIIPFLLDRFL